MWTQLSALRNTGKPYLTHDPTPRPRTTTHDHAPPPVTHHAPHVFSAEFSPLARWCFYSTEPIRASGEQIRGANRSSLVAHSSLGLGGSLFRRTASDMRRACFLACFLIWSTASPTWWEMSAEVVVDVVATAAEPGGE